MVNLLGYRTLLIYIYICICEIEDKKILNFFLACANSESNADKVAYMLTECLSS